MSAAEHQSPDISPQPPKKSLQGPPRRPSLVKPPARPEVDSQSAKPQPKSPAVDQPAPQPAAATETAEVTPETTETANPSTFTNHPIAPPSEPMQYRAIGLVRGVYQPSEEQLNRGCLMAEDGAAIDAVLLGRVTSLIKKHINLESSHLWVVYPRTRKPSEKPEEEADGGALHLQVVGVWEPETLGLPGENPNTNEDEESVETSSDASVAAAAPVEADDQVAADDQTEADDQVAADDQADDQTEADPETAEHAVPAENYFSIRGEVLNYDEDAEDILVKIVQGAKRSGKPPKAFKLNVSGKISGKTVGYFWELDIERQGEALVLTSGRSVGIVPPKKKKKRGKPFGGGRRGGRRPQSDGTPKPSPVRSKEKPRIRPSAPVKSNPL